jgi:hypothetical protein
MESGGSYRFWSIYDEREIMKHILTMAALAAATALPATAAPIMLYDGAQAGTPDTQGWLTITDGSDYMQAVAGGTNINTADAGNFGILSNQDIFGETLVNPEFPTLNRQQGYTVSFTGVLANESHDGSQPSVGEINAGWTLLATSSDNFGVQIGFRNDQFYSLSSGGEYDSNKAVNYSLADLTAHTFDLNIHGSEFTLFMDNHAELTGQTYDTSSFGDFYALPNLLLMGDFSSTASVDYTLSSFSVSVPEPWAICPMLLGLALLVRPRRRRVA